MNNFKDQLETYTKLYWWNMGKKTLSHSGMLKSLLENQNIKYSKRATSIDGIFMFTFTSAYGVTFKQRGTITDFSHFTKQAIQMELVRMGDKSELYVSGCWRPTVTVNF